MRKYAKIITNFLASHSKIERVSYAISPLLKMEDHIKFYNKNGEIIKYLFCCTKFCILFYNS